MPANSALNRMLTLDYILHEKENKYFDCKSAQIKPSDLAPLISGFANADGGTIVVGISDKTRTLEGIDFVGYDKINDFINAPKEFCQPMPRYQEEFLDIVNADGEPDSGERGTNHSQHTGANMAADCRPNQGTAWR